MIRQISNYYILHTEHTTYCFRVLDTGHLEHLYYGRRLRLPQGGKPETDDAALSWLEALSEKHAYAPGCTCVYDPEHKNFTLEDMRLEMSSYGKGDTREPFVELVHEDGSATCDFLFDRAEIINGKAEYRTLPGSYDEQGKVEQLNVTLKDAQYQVTLELHYYVYEDCDVITRSARLVNDGEGKLWVERLLSAQLDLDSRPLVFTTFNGAWGREMQKNDTDLIAGRHVNESLTGNSSCHANPFVMLHPRETTEDAGECFGFNLIYSGNHYEAAEVSSFGKIRFVTGIHPGTFRFLLQSGEDLEAPEAVMSYSCQGFNGLSIQMQHFVREHIVRGKWKHKTRPVLLNSWEAAYFDINERKLLALAKAGKEAGMELFVMDDGWFGSRNDDTQSLGDWEVNEKKIPGGLANLARKVNALGMDFGLWVEPEMVNVNSKLYEAHPDWVLQISGKPHSEGRNQRILDLTRTEVQDFIIDKMSGIFSSAEIAYVKWDMNRNFTDYFSQAIPSERQGEVAHRYYIGLYHCMKTLTERFPHILFEGCASGGNRFDLGILCYFPQIWASDDTDPVCRAQIQTGYSYGYPMSVVSAHVSASPNHQTLRSTPLETRFNVAAFGICGYECNLCDMKREELAAVKAQVALYKEWREVLQWGDFYRGRSFLAGGQSALDRGNNLTEWTCVSPDRSKAVGMLLQQLVIPNTQFHTYYARGLDPERVYHFYNRELKYNVKEFGDLVNTVSPFHVKLDSLMHNVIARFVKLEGETEDYMAGGDVLMYGGVHLKQAFGGTGYNNEVRHFQDFGSRIYFMESEKSV
ncbi:MAG: alpha-galactosidase [Candidatus Gastranaerophilales bacterium]|nr:alpha-galactosidase [Candidatus Gastranaerophilales bacterium]